MKKIEDNLRDLQGNIKQSNIHIKFYKEKIERKGQKAYMKKIMAENFPNLGKKQTSRSRKPSELQIR